MGDLIKLEQGLGYPHLVCYCKCNTFHVQTTTCDDDALWMFLHCAQCGNKIPVMMTPITDGN